MESERIGERCNGTHCKGLWGRVCSVAGEQAAIDDSVAGGVTSGWADGDSPPGAENCGLKRANEILKRASSFFGVDSAGRLLWEAADVIQCDLSLSAGGVPLEGGATKLCPVIVMTAGFFRFTIGGVLPARKTSDLLGVSELSQGFGKAQRRPSRLEFFSTGVAHRIETLCSAPARHRGEGCH